MAPTKPLRFKEPSKFSSALTPIFWLLLGPPIAWAIIVIIFVGVREVLNATFG